MMENSQALSTCNIQTETHFYNGCFIFNKNITKKKKKGLTIGTCRDVLVFDVELHEPWNAVDEREEDDRHDVDQHGFPAAGAVAHEGRQRPKIIVVKENKLLLEFFLS
jgi:hypothetical protein